MTEVISTILGATQLGSIALIAWLVIKIVSAEQTAADARVAQVATEEHFAEVAFRLEQVKAVLAQETAENEALTSAARKAEAAPINADLAPNDIAGRLRRLVAGWSDADAVALKASEPASSSPPSKPN